MPAHSLLFSKSTMRAARQRPHPTDETLSAVLYAFSTYILWKASVITACATEPHNIYRLFLPQYILYVEKTYSTVDSDSSVGWRR